MSNGYWRLRCSLVFFTIASLCLTKAAGIGWTPDQFKKAFPAANRWMTAKQRTIVICMDGTWNTPKIPTNVRRIYEIAQGLTSTSPVIAYYDKGVGSTRLQRYPNGITGFGHQKNVHQAYRFLCMTWKPGDQLYIVGFSRGAYQARLLCGMIDYFGIHYSERTTSLRRDNESLEGPTKRLLDLFRKNGDRESARVLAGKSKSIRWEMVDMQAKEGWKRAEIQSLICFDTVAAIIKKIKIEKKKNKEFRIVASAEVPQHHRAVFPTTKLALHAMALDEFRGPFVLVPFESPLPYSILQERWFAGAHSDVGGGYKEWGLGANSLNWVLTTMSTASTNDFVVKSHAVAPDLNPFADIHDEGDRWKYGKPVARLNVSQDAFHDSVDMRISRGGYKPNSPLPDDGDQINPCD